MRSSYLSSAISGKNLAIALQKSIEMLTEFGLDRFDSIAFRGMSGALLAPALCAALGKDVIIVRKDDGSHSSHKVEGNSLCDRYIIVDDFISSGQTVNITMDMIKEFLNHDAEPAAILLYMSGYDNGKKHTHVNGSETDIISFNLNQMV